MEREDGFVEELEANCGVVSLWRVGEAPAQPKNVSPQGRCSRALHMSLVLETWGNLLMMEPKIFSTFRAWKFLWVESRKHFRFLQFFIYVFLILFGFLRSSKLLSRGAMFG